MFKHLRTFTILAWVYVLVADLIPAGFVRFKTTLFWKGITDPFFWLVFEMMIAFPILLGIVAWGRLLE
ncbi:hypothetical protein LCGC14_0429610 [marine sediment metagenome]|uniref:Uncharacterized protein n=1 Tax=marine sediment metagenome TaxID=412755 RepID=A0A0F9SNC6_9ZZZZ